MFVVYIAFRNESRHISVLPLVTIIIASMGFSIVSRDVKSDVSIERHQFQAYWQYKWCEHLLVFRLPRTRITKRPLSWRVLTVPYYLKLSLNQNCNFSRINPVNNYFGVKMGLADMFPTHMVSVHNLWIYSSDNKIESFLCDNKSFVVQEWFMKQTAISLIFTPFLNFVGLWRTRSCREAIPYHNYAIWIRRSDLWWSCSAIFADHFHFGSRSFTHSNRKLI